MSITNDEIVELTRARRRARTQLHAYITYTSPRYKCSDFSRAVCAALDKFTQDVLDRKRPILILQAPPQHGKSEIVSRKLPAYLLGRFPDWRIGTASYSSDLANEMGQWVRRYLDQDEHKVLFPSSAAALGKYDLNRIGQFNAAGGSGGYISVGIGQGLTGKSVDIGIIDDPTKNQEEALSPVTKESHWNWYQSVFTTRLSEYSGQIIMATAWAEDDLPGRIAEHFKGDERLTHLRFPAINEEGEVGYDPELPLGALVPELHSLEKLIETKGILGDTWWCAMYQQSPKSLGGNIFKDFWVQYYELAGPRALPKKFDRVLSSWDCTFKDTDGTDFVVGGVWGKTGARAYLLDLVRARMSFTTTAAAIKALNKKWPQSREILIEDKANGPAVIDFLKKSVPGLIPIEPDGSKEARAHAVSPYWEALNVFIPHQDLFPWVRPFVSEITIFPAGRNDDQVDMMTQALRRLYPAKGRLKIGRAAINRALGVA
jgi:predicted phage terminase large subunit-like protein